jgi:hypothetical protein
MISCIRHAMTNQVMDVLDLVCVRVFMVRSVPLAGVRLEIKIMQLNTAKRREVCHSRKGQRRNKLNVS